MFITRGKVKDTFIRSSGKPSLPIALDITSEGQEIPELFLEFDLETAHTLRNQLNSALIRVAESMKKKNPVPQADGDDGGEEDGRLREPLQEGKGQE